MNRIALFPLAILSCGSYGCASAHEAHEVHSGIYELDVRVERDACSPMREAGSMGLVGVVSEAGVLNLAVPAGIDARLARVSLARDAGLHAEVAMAIPGCEGANVRRSWTVIGVSRGRFEVLFEQAWSGMSGCEVPRDLMPMAPLGDCEASQVLEYVMLESCPRSCDLRITGTGATCSC